MVIEVPYQWFEDTFWSFIAQNFNKIMFCIFIAGFIIRHIPWNTFRLNETQRNWRSHYNHTKNKADEAPKWSPTGWYWDKDKRQWIAPDYSIDEPNTKWKWDEEKGIWIDLEKASKMERYKEFRKGKPPTFEEWKAAREAEEQKETK